MNWEAGTEGRHIIFFPEPTMSAGCHDHVFWTDDGGIGFSVGGHVVVKPFREWHKLGAQLSAHALHKAIAISDHDPAADPVQHPWGGAF